MKRILVCDADIQIMYYYAVLVVLNQPFGTFYFRYLDIHSRVFKS